MKNDRQRPVSEIGICCERNVFNFATGNVPPCLNRKLHFRRGREVIEEKQRSLKKIIFSCFQKAAKSNANIHIKVSGSKFLPQPSGIDTPLLLFHMERHLHQSQMHKMKLMTSESIVMSSVA